MRRQKERKCWDGGYPSSEASLDEDGRLIHCHGNKRLVIKRVDISWPVECRPVDRAKSGYKIKGGANMENLLSIRSGTVSPVLLG